MPLSRNTARGGALVLVVGPSGAGKDSVLSAAKDVLQNDPRYVFVRREITRPAAAGGEDHIGVSEAAFAETARAGGYALWWRAHGLGYGVPASIGDDLASGKVVAVNVSRGVIEAARAAFPDVRVCHITTSPDVLRARLAARGRESAQDIEDRVARASAFSIEGDGVIDIRNDGPLDVAVAAFLKVLCAL